MQSIYADLKNMARNTFSIIPHRVAVEASVSLWRGVIGWRQSKTRVKTLRKEVGVSHFTLANTGPFPGENPALDTTNTDSNLEEKSEAKQMKLYRMAKVQDVLEMWRGSRNLCAT